jgi:hypothetical protein
MRSKKVYTFFINDFIQLHIVSLTLQPSADYGLLVPWGFSITHNDAPEPVRILWTSDQLVAETHDRSRRAAVDLRLRPRSHWDRLFSSFIQYSQAPSGHAYGSVKITEPVKTILAIYCTCIRQCKDNGACKDSFGNILYMHTAV